MKTFLLVALSALLAFNVAAQRAISSFVTLPKPSPAKTVKFSTDDTLFWSDFMGSPVLYLANGGGFVGGQNTSGNIGMMQRFQTAQGGYINNVMYWFGHKEGTGNIRAVIWNDIGGAPGNKLAEVTVPYSLIDTALDSTPLTAINFSTPVQIPLSLTFWVGYEFSYAPGDTVGLVSDMDGDFPTAATDTYEESSDSTFHSVFSTWGINIAWAIFPVVHWDTSYYNTIRGNVFIDSNGNGIKDGTETGVANQVVNAGSSYNITDANGDYMLGVDTGYHTVKPILQGYLTSNPDSIVVHFPGIGTSSIGNDFACQALPGIRDLSVSIVSDAFRPGFSCEYYVYVENGGSQIESGSVALKYDTQLIYYGSYPTEDSISGNTVFWKFTNLLPQHSYLVNAYMETPPGLALGSYIHSSAYVNPIIGDTVPANNYDTLSTIVVGSYDPNDKLVYPAGTGTQGYIGFSTTPLEYTIRFQNTGTDTAFTVVVKDTLDAGLDISTLKILSSSHPASLSLENNHVLNFTFSNILLPDSNVNRLSSSGFVKYSVSPKHGLIQNTAITNNAYIYFDFNQPVVTNTTLNTVGFPVGFDEIKTSASSEFFPNPMNVYATIKIASANYVANATLQIYDILGNLVLSSNGINTNEIRIYRGNLNRGIYFYKVSNSKGLFASGKFIIE